MRWINERWTKKMKVSAVNEQLSGWKRAWTSSKKNCASGPSCTQNSDLDILRINLYPVNKHLENQLRYRWIQIHT